MSSRDGLLDTGVVVGFIDADEERHEECVAALKAFRGRLFSTEAVVTEAMHLLNHYVPGRGARACADFFLHEACILVPTSLTALARCSDLMKKYADVPMDYADATLVALAEDLGVRRILTLDRRGFQAYRCHGRTPFDIVP